ncbi:MAG: tRNA preQ1(34) S-adenosylmethionine ribosyltransferase-isomerase QueA [Rickettsiales bacterium]|nr:tRNA preQ1(34) S-adenosylmethionine ribosyltransferase-isomerase QueA [Rickettsiales bacterium]
MLKTSDFDFYLPPKLIANQPFFPKEETAMLTFKDNQIFDLKLINLLDFLQEGDVMVFNDARVIKAKLSAKILRNSQKLEFNLDQKLNDFSIKDSPINVLWRALCKPAKKVKVGDDLEIANDFFAQVIEKSDDGFIKIKFDCDEKTLAEKIEKYGATPLPPYIKSDLNNFQDQKNYQTIYANNGEAVAAPTAGLHFNEKIFAALANKKIKKVFVTLNVGAGTFLPVRSNFLNEHKMHNESFCLSKESAEIINLAKAHGKKIIAIGTTSLRVLESCCDEKNILQPNKSSTEIFIYPPYKFKIVDILLTNFHLPKSTLFMLICAFVGKEQAFLIYNHAISKQYRFYSYGDASLLFKNDQDNIFSLSL